MRPTSGQVGGEFGGVGEGGAGGRLVGIAGDEAALAENADVFEIGSLGSEAAIDNPVTQQPTLRNRGWGTRAI